ncbi:pectinesterase [Ziziphus jujuba]|uniref:Pectinesterase n=1 Tax=Ziziphus jujuba TaxID=326968 RepID=A0A6P3ZW99_ZIZJJ|nr:pectinesterase [Ziziphus jujuba]
MASKHFSFIGISFFILFPLISLPSHADNTLPFPFGLTPPVSPENVCKFTQFPSFCKSVLPNHNDNVYGFGRFSFQRSVSQSQIFFDLIDKLLKSNPNFSKPAIRALQDCHYLASLNQDFLSTCSQTVKRTSKILARTEAENVQTKLSAILTNLQTCVESLDSTNSAGTIKNDILNSLLNDTKFQSISLDLFKKGWVPKQRGRGKSRQPPKIDPTSRNGRMALGVSSQNHAIFEAILRRSKRVVRAAGNGDSVLIKDIVTVSKEGWGNFTTINEAIAAAPSISDASDGYFFIYVAAGIYEEYVSIARNQNYLFILGDGIGQTIITGNRSVGDGWTTFNSATFAVVGEGFLGVDITFRNTAGPSKGQAVALRNGADLSTFYSCSFEGYQDTLYPHSLRQFYRECDIYGTIDFIFGNGAVVFQNCNIFPRLPIKGQFDPITAQGRTDPNQNTGFSFQNCTIRAAEDLGATKTYLGRPWKEYARTVFMQSFMDKLIDLAGWSVWNGDFALSTLYYAEYDNTGPGSDTTMRVAWPGYHVIDATDADDFTVSNFLLGDNWLHKTGVPYIGGLI